MKAGLKTACWGVIWLISPLLWAATQTHPVELAPDTDSSTCLECHSALQEGKYVHTAMSMGCLTCHAIQRDGGITTVTLVSPSRELCFTCHQKSSDPVQHQPYSEGLCVACHSPHSSNFPAHTLAAEQELCMGCHVRGMAKLSDKNRTVSVPWGATLTFKEVPRWDYIGLNQAHTANHPVMGHPVTGPNTLLGKSAPAITCLSCHKTHSSTQSNLRPPQFRDQMALCVSCHTNM